MKAWLTTLFWAIIWWGSFTLGAFAQMAKDPISRVPKLPDSPLMNEYLFWAFALVGMYMFGRSAMKIPFVQKWLG